MEMYINTGGYNPMKKIIAFSATMLLGIGVFAGLGKANIKSARAELTNDQVTAMQTLLDSYIGEDHTYTKKSRIFLTNEGVQQEYFHAGHTVLERTTYYTSGALLMGDLNGGFETINSGYANDGAGNMVHYRSKDGVAGLTESAQRTVDYTVNGKTMADYFFNLDDLRNSIVAADWSVSEGVYTHTIGSLDLDENGDYQDTLLKKFQYFTAPMLLQNKKDVAHYLSPSSITVQEFAGALLIKILSPSDSGKIQEGHDDILAEAWVYHDILMPGYFVTGDFASWKLANANRMGAGDEDNYAISNSLTISTAGGMKVVHLLEDGTTAWHGAGGTADSNNISVQAANYYVSVSKNESTDGHVSAVRIPGSISFIGKYGTYNFDHDEPLTVNGIIATLNGVELKAGDTFKLREDGAWDISYGAGITVNCLEGVYDTIGTEGANLKILADGTYNFSFNLETHALTVSGTLPATEITYHLVGDFNGWTDSDDNIMTRIGLNIYKLEHVSVEADKREVKVHASDGWHSPDGNNYVIGDGAGTYTVFFNSSNNAMWVSLEA